MSLATRVVVVSRRSERDELLARHGAKAAAAFFLRSRGRDLDEVEARHAALADALAAVGAAIPLDWRRGHVDRADLDRFLFSPEDIIVIVGQDGLVANVAKYLDGQPVIGVDPEPGRNAGALVRHRPDKVGPLLAAAGAGRAAIDARTMVAATLDDGQVLAGLNEVYVGHATHQSSRYVLRVPGGGTERHSSSGLIVGTGTGASGWCASIAGERRATAPLPAPGSADLCWFVREAWPSPATGIGLTAGLLAGDQQLEIASESDQLVAFADGLEHDRLTVTWGQRITVGVGHRRLYLVAGT